MNAEIGDRISSDDVWSTCWREWCSSCWTQHNVSNLGWDIMNGTMVHGRMKDEGWRMKDEEARWRMKDEVHGSWRMRKPGEQIEKIGQETEHLWGSCCNCRAEQWTGWFASRSYLITKVKLCLTHQLHVIGRTSLKDVCIYEGREEFLIIWQCG